MSRPGHNTHATRHHGSKRKLVLWMALAAVVLGVWLAVVLALGGGGEGGERGGSTGHEKAESTSAGEQASAGGDSAGRDAGEGDDESSGDGSGESQNVSDDVLSERPGGGVPEGQVAIEVEEGRTTGQRGFVSSFVGAAYGYTGEDVEEYRSGYEGRIDTGTYYDSPGGQTLRYYASLVDDGGAQNAAVLREYRILSGEAVEQQVAASELRGFVPRQLMDSETPEGATVSEVIYAVGNRYGDPAKDEDFGQVYGDVEYLKQRLFMARTGEGGGWVILAASSPKPTEDPDAGEPAPGAPKVGYEPPGGHEHGHEHGAS